MKGVFGLVKVLAAGLLVFMLLAVGQEWEVFATGLGLRGAASAPPVEPAAAERQAAEAAIRQFLSLARHYYLSAGDPRFTERMQASPAVVDEIARDVAYLRKNGRIQDLALVSVQTIGAAALGEGAIELKTREYWVIRTRFGGSGQESDPAHATVVLGRYVVRRTDAGWRVEAWEPLPDEEPVGP